MDNGDVKFDDLPVQHGDFHGDFVGLPEGKSQKMLAHHKP